ncbi:MAG: GNAT family N-acetyltransferase [Bradyrhizobiaceae bacterium]|nr:GNAT family N-acetyltransferase [Hyphomicrobiales bacterium]MBV9428646.1 GNAT family N-acetyltransferase [Bradyrhizobiaceae bacterium]
MTPAFITEPLDRHHDRDAFVCGSDALDRYLKERASQDIRRRVAGCFVAVGDGGKIVGYYTLAATSVRLDAQPGELAKRLPRYPAVPAVLMGRLAIALGHQGKGLGSALIVDAAARVDRVGIGAFALVVDAKDDRAKIFYEANGFVSLPDEERRLCLPIETALQALRE